MEIRIIPNSSPPNSKSQPTNNTHEPLVKKQGPNSRNPISRLTDAVLGCFGKLLSKKKLDGGIRSEEEEKVYSWLRTLAQTERNLAFEYVRSTERGLSFSEAEARLREVGQNAPHDQTFRSWWQILRNAVLHPFIVILIVLSALSYLTGDNGNGIIMLILVFITVSLRFYQEFNSSKAAMKLSELLKSPVKVQRCAGRYIQTELLVQVDQTEIVPGDIIHFSPGDLFPGDMRLLTSKDLVVSQSSLTGESGTMEKIGDIIEDPNTPLLEQRNICFMGTSVVAGYGTGLVVSTGSKTYMSTIFSTLGKQTPPDAFAIGVRRISSNYTTNASSYCEYKSRQRSPCNGQRQMHSQKLSCHTEHGSNFPNLEEITVLTGFYEPFWLVDIGHLTVLIHFSCSLSDIVLKLKKAKLFEIKL